MTTTLADPVLDPTKDFNRDWRVRESPAGTGPERHERFWLLDARWREEAFTSETAFVVSAAIAVVLSGVAAYFYGLWMYGPV